MNDFIAWLWSFLPDRCQVQGCSRAGTRGNENVINGVTVCDYCHYGYVSMIDYAQDDLTEYLRGPKGNGKDLDGYEMETEVANLYLWLILKLRRPVDMVR